MNIDVTKNTKVIPINDMKKYIRDNFPMLGFSCVNYIVYKGVNIEPFLPDAFYEDIIPNITFGEVEKIQEVTWITLYTAKYDRIRIPMIYNTEKQHNKIYERVSTILTKNLNDVAACFKKEFKRIERLKNITFKNAR